jgi:hypothetical protein
VLDQVVLDEDPGTPDFGAGYLAGLCACTQFLWVAPQKGGSFN